MAPRNPEKLAKKNQYLDKLQELIHTMPNVLIVESDYVGSKQIQEIRITLRGKAVILMGKNTMIRYALRQYEGSHPDKDLSKLLPIVKGNIGFIFCKEGVLDEVRKVIVQNRVPAAAKAGIVAMCDVTVPSGPTSLDPSQTSFFQALNIATKIVKGQIEIINEVHLIKKGLKVQMSEQVLLQKLNVRPFAYGLNITHIYDHGSVFDAAVLDITDDLILSKFSRGVQNVAAFSREVGIPTLASVPHAIVSAFKNCAALCSDIEFTFPEIAKVKEFLKDPSKFASAGAAASPKAGAADKGKAAAAPAAKEEEEEEEEEAFDLFG